MEHISIDSIVVENRFRKDMGDIDGLAASIEELGQLQPIVINKDRRLIAGARRLAAMKQLGRETIAASVFDLDDIDALKVERDENDQRKEPTVSERVALAQAIAERLDGRKGSNQHVKKEGQEIFPDAHGQQTRDIAAKKAGLGSGKTLEAAQRVVERGVPELVEAMDAGKVTIHAAKNLATLPPEEQSALDYDDKESVRKARAKADARERRAIDPTYGKPKPKPAQNEAPAQSALPQPDESRLYEEGSCLSAWVLAARAKGAIEQISKNDPNAVNAIASIQLAIDRQRELINQ